MIIALILNILLSYFIAKKLGETRTIGFGWCFIACLFLSPLGGVIVALLFPSIHSRKIDQMNPNLIEDNFNTATTQYEERLNSNPHKKDFHNFLLMKANAMKQGVRMGSPGISENALNKKVISLLPDWTFEEILRKSWSFPDEYGLTEAEVQIQINDFCTWYSNVGVFRN